MSHDYAVVDVFASRPLTGNPLAVVTEADDLAEETMAAVAVEFNLGDDIRHRVDPPRCGSAGRLTI